MSKKYNWFSPSNAQIWSQCPGAVKIAQPYLKLYDKSEAALEGIAAHWVAEQMHVGVIVEAGAVAKNGTVVTQEMIDCAEEYLDIIEDGAILEQKVDYSSVSKGMFGYIDAYKVADNDLYIYDYKYGHTLVETFENNQLLVTAKGLLDLYPNITNIHMEIFQPRVYTDQDPKWSLSVADFNADYLPALLEAARDVMSKNPELNTGSHCLRCKARQGCVALRESTLAIVDVSKGPSTLDLPPEELGQELSVLMDAQDRIKARVVGLEEQAKLEFSKGNNVVGFTLQPTVGNLKWNVPVSKVLTIGEVLSVDLKKPPALLTPTQAIKQGMDEKTVNGLSGRAQSGAKLKRVDYNKMRKVFKK